MQAFVVDRSARAEVVGPRDNLYTSSTSLSMRNALSFGHGVRTIREITDFDVDGVTFWSFRHSGGRRSSLKNLCATAH